MPPSMWSPFLHNAPPPWAPCWNAPLHQMSPFLRMPPSMVPFFQQNAPFHGLSLPVECPLHYASLLAEFPLSWRLPSSECPFHGAFLPAECLPKGTQSECPITTGNSLPVEYPLHYASLPAECPLPWCLPSSRVPPFQVYAYPSSSLPDLLGEEGEPQSSLCDSFRHAETWA